MPIFTKKYYFHSLSSIKFYSGGRGIISHLLQAREAEGGIIRTRCRQQMGFTEIIQIGMTYSHISL